MKYLVVDVDTGVDDAWGLFLFLSQKPEEFKILGITCVNGNTSLDCVCKNTLHVLGTAKRMDVPVFKGASKPLICPEEEHHSLDLKHYHGLNGFGDIELEEPQLKPKLETENAVVALNRIVSENKGKVSLVCFAPLTNIALAIRTYPDFVENLKEIFIMGGNYTAKGNTTMSAEFNFHTDPEAAKIVITSAVDKITLLPWETCCNLSIPYTWRLEVLGKGTGAAVELLNKIEESVMERGKRNGLKTWVSCDQLLAAIVVRPEMVLEVDSLHATVELSGNYTRGQLVVDHLNTRQHNIRIIKQVDQQLLQQLMLTLANFP